MKIRSWLLICLVLVMSACGITDEVEKQLPTTQASVTQMANDEFRLDKAVCDFIPEKCTDNRITGKFRECVISKCRPPYEKAMGELAAQIPKDHAECFEENIKDDESYRIPVVDSADPSIVIKFTFRGNEISMKEMSSLVCNNVNPRIVFIDRLRAESVRGSMDVWTNNAAVPSYKSCIAEKKIVWDDKIKKALSKYRSCVAACDDLYCPPISSTTKKSFFSIFTTSMPGTTAPLTTAAPSYAQSTTSSSSSTDWS